ncbi:MAG: response regulator, partial [Desulfobacterales bacterium]
MTDLAKLLIVDDELSMREFLEIMLGKEGYEVKSAETGKQANAMLDKEAFDLVLCDIR